MNFLPVDVFRHLLFSLSEQDQIQLLDCSSSYREVKKAVRKVTVDAKKLKRCYEDETYLTKLNSLIEDSGKQLIIEARRLKLSDCESFPFTKIFMLTNTTFSFLSKLYSVKNDLSIETIKIIDTVSEDISKADTLLKLCELGRVKNIVVKHNEASGNFSLPYFPNVESIDISNGVMGGMTQISLPSLYASHLQQLVLSRCSGIDVSGLSHIPSLTINNCDCIRGISSLQNNRRISVIGCTLDGGDPIPGAFPQSEDITLEIFNDYPTRLNVTTWKKAKNVYLKSNKSNENIVLDTYSLPSTVKRCLLGCVFVERMKFFCDHLMHLTLYDSGSITSLQGMGLETIPILNLEWLYNLPSLQGLGGRNKKVTLRSCNQIEDFSVLRSVDTVIIDHCKGFEDISQVNEVRELELLLINPIIHMETLGEKLEVLSINSNYSCDCSSFSALSKIPHLILKYPDLDAIQETVSSEGRINNLTITIYYSVKDRQKMREISDSKDLFSEYHLVEMKDLAVRFIRKLLR